MRTLFITGNDERHTYIIKKFSKYFKNFKWVTEIRDININHKTLKKNYLYKKHICDFNYQQRKTFSGIKLFKKKHYSRISSINREKVNSKEFNDKIIEILKSFKPQVLFSYGCQKINTNKIQKFKIKCFNIHGGLLPEYRGVNTNFWPHFNLESNKVGITLHKLTNRIDLGEIYFQTSVQIKLTDTINILSCKAVKNFADTVPKKIFNLLKKKKIKKGIKTKGNYKQYMKKDFHTSHIKIAKRNFLYFKKYLNNSNDQNLINLF